jgi:hypothetical protein
MQPHEVWNPTGKEDVKQEELYIPAAKYIPRHIRYNGCA